MNLQVESERLNSLLADAANEWRASMAEVDAQILNYEKILADKESKTDRSENATFQIASDGRAAAMAVKATLRAKLDAYNTHRQNYTPIGVVREGSTLHLRCNDEDIVVKIVPHNLSDAIKGLIDVESPVGRAAIGLSAGATFAVKTRKGRLTYNIEGVY